jgi:lysine 6-dehydrogenase
LLVKPALSEPELLNFPGIGTLEAFNSDGLRSLLNLDIPDMKEKTLRYPGHLDTVKLLRDSGFFSPVEVDIKGVQVKPVDLTSKLLFKLWQLNEHDDEFTVMQVNIETEGKTYSYSLLDRRNKESGFSSMARTTGYTCTAVVNLLAEGKIKQKGISPPELIGMDENNFRFILEYLKKRDIVVQVQENSL